MSKVQENSIILRVGFSLSKRPLFNSIYLVRVPFLISITVSTKMPTSDKVLFFERWGSNFTKNPKYLKTFIYWGIVCLYGRMSKTFFLLSINFHANHHVSKYLPIESDNNNVGKEFHKDNFAPKDIESDIIWIFSQWCFV